ncbi:MAG TPA: ABC transporter substrate-binding protein [Conexibacter sp.]|jgi:branched-chain amino acid transport system substrate-binding protein
MVKRRVLGLAALASVGVLAAGCGSSESSSSGSSAGKSSEPVKIGLIVPLSGAAANPKIYVDPANDAVARLNADGGIDGRRVQVIKYDSGFTPEEAITAARKATSDGVSALIGLPVVSQVLAVKPVLDQSKLPLLFLGGGQEAEYHADDSKGASEYSFRIGTPANLTTESGVEFSIRNLRATDIGLLLRQESAAQSNQELLTRAATDNGGRVSAARVITEGGTDVTSELLPMKDTDAIVSNDYPPTLALILRQMQQYQMTQPLVGEQSAAQVFINRLAPAALTKSLYSETPCNPSDSRRPETPAWTRAYESAHGYTPDANSAITYDSFSILKDAYEKAGSSDSADVLKQLESLDYTGGVCEDYKTDPVHVTGHSAVIMSFADGTPRTVQEFDGL